MIQINNLTKSFQNNLLFKNISFQINPGEKIGLVGRNGYGKTTLIKIILNLEESDEGEIVISKNW